MEKKSVYAKMSEKELTHILGGLEDGNKEKEEEACAGKSCRDSCKRKKRGTNPDAAFIDDVYIGDIYIAEEAHIL